MMAGQHFSMTQLVALWIKAGGSLATAPAAVAHAWAESSGDAAVTSANPDGGTNVGLWQLDTEGVGAGHSVAELQNPLTNAQITVKGSNDGRNWGPWPDAWSSHIGAATAAVHAFSAQSQSHPGGIQGLANDVLKGVESIWSGIGSAVSGAAGAVGSAVGSVLSLPSQVTDFLTAAERFTHAALWIVNPANWARIMAGGAAVILLVIGLGALTRAA